MCYQIKENKGDFIVEVFIPYNNETLRGIWYPIKNFKSKEGDAKQFKEINCKYLTTNEINKLIKNNDNKTSN